MKLRIAIIALLVAVVLAIVCVPLFVRLRMAANLKSPANAVVPNAAPPREMPQAAVQPMPNQVNSSAHGHKDSSSSGSSGGSHLDHSDGGRGCPQFSACFDEPGSGGYQPSEKEQQQQQAERKQWQTELESRRSIAELRGEAARRQRAGAFATSAPPPPPDAVSISDLGKSPSAEYKKKTTYDFESQVIEGDLARPDAPNTASSQSKPITISEVTIVGDESIERYPNIEAPETVAAGQEIAVQVSLTTEQLAPETKILSGEQHDGKLQLHMGLGDDRWTLTVNLTAPGMEFTRGGNTASITVTRAGDSTLAVFYLRPLPAATAAETRRETRILATLLHDGAFIARLSRPLTIVTLSSQPGVSTSASSLHAGQPAATPLVLVQPVVAAPSAALASRSEIRIDPDLEAPDLTIIENRVGNTLRLVFFSPHTQPVEADISDPDALHAWIEIHYAQMAMHGRGIAVENDAQQGSPQHAVDYADGFGSELYDRFAPQVFKNLFWNLMDNSVNHSPENKRAKWRFEYIQVLSDDPAIPWELMRPARVDGSDRFDFLGLHFSIARWPLGTRGAARPPQLLAVSQSAVIAPVYRGAQQLASTGVEMKTLEKMQGFAHVPGNYSTVRDLAMHLPQGIVHFAGHGAVTDVNGVPQFAILLEDSQMDPATWQALVPANSGAHPLFFFNACDVGESRRFSNDVDGWAPVLLSNGASGYIGALWPGGIL